MSNTTPLVTRLIELYKDSEFKAEFTQNYLKHGASLTTIDNEYTLAFKMINNSVATATVPALSSVSSHKLKRILLSISSTGLSFEPMKKHFYLSTQISTSGALEPLFILGYRGMRYHAAKSDLVDNILCDVVFESDSFTWLGNDTRPLFSSPSSRENDDIVCAFAGYIMKDGSFMGCKIPKEQLYSSAEKDIQLKLSLGLRAEDSLYGGPWREKCFRVLAQRALFRDFHDFFDISPELFSDNEGDQECDLSKQFEEALAGANQ